MENNRFYKCEVFIIILIGFILFFIAGFRPVGIDNDSGVYEQAIYYLNYGVYIITEPAFLIIAGIANAFSDYPVRMVLLIYAGISIFLKIYAIGRFSRKPLFSFLIYICLFFILHDFTQIRAGVSAGFFLFAYYDAINGRKIKFLIKIIFAILFHYSSILFIPLIFFSRNKINIKLYLALPFVFLPLMISPGMLQILSVLFSYLPMGLSERAVNYSQQLQDGQSGFGLLQLCMFFLFILYGWALAKRPSYAISVFDNLSFKYLSLTFVLYFAFSPIPIVAVRTFELMSVSLVYILPAIVDKLKPKILLYYLIVCWLIGYFSLVSLRIVDFTLIAQY